MKAFKTVQDFAAKEQHLPDSQRGWQSWTSSQRGHDKKEPDDDDDARDEETTKRVKIDDKGEWTKLQGTTDGKPYWFNAKTGETRRSPPDSNNDENDEESESEGPEEEEQEEATAKVVMETPAVPPVPRLPPQEWEQTRDPLTRKPAWFCAEIDATISFEPLPEPWRGVKDLQGRVYFWNPQTGETRWS